MIRTHHRKVTALSVTLSTLVACDTSQPTPTTTSSLSQQDHTSVTFAPKSEGDSPAQCLVAETQPSLWLPLDGVDDQGLVREVVQGLNGMAVSPDGIPLFEQGAVGAAIVLDGNSYVDVFDMNRIDTNPDGFSFGLWVKPDGGGRGTLLSHALRFSPGSWRLLSTGRGGLDFEVCDLDFCQTFTLPDSLPDRTWTYVGGILDVIVDPSGMRLDISLEAHNGDQVQSMTDRTLLSESFGFYTNGSLTIGGSLDDVPDDQEYEEPHVVTTPSDLFIGQIDEVMFYDAPVSEGVITSTADAQEGVCEDCIHDVIPPEIYCPPSMSLMGTFPVRPENATATDNCDPDPDIIVAVSSAEPGKTGDTITVTYTAIDASGNQSTCESQITMVDPPPPAADKATLGRGRCSITAAPNPVTTGANVTLTLTNFPGSCSNGTCDVKVDLNWSGINPSSGNPQSMTLHLTDLYNQTYLDYDTSRTGTQWSMNADLLSPRVSWIQAVYRVYDHTSHEYLGDWICDDSITINPVVQEYCGHPISYWDDRVTINTAHYFNLSDPNVYNGNGWFHGTPGDDIILGSSGPDKIKGDDGADCIIGNNGQDEVDGGYGDDWIEGGGDADKLDGQEENDTIFGGPGADDIWGGQHTDWLHGGTGGDHIWGEEDPDFLWGDDGADTIKGGGLEDTIDGGTGNDTIKGNEHHDDITGGDGCDTIEGDGGRDDIDGGNGDDRIWGGDEEDIINGDGDRDYIRGSGGMDTLSGGDGNDFMCGIGNLNHHYGEGGDNDECRQNPNNGWMVCEDPNGRECNHNNWEVPTLWNCN